MEQIHNILTLSDSRLAIESRANYVVCYVITLVVYFTMAFELLKVVIIDNRVHRLIFGPRKAVPTQIHPAGALWVFFSYSIRILQHRNSAKL